MKNLRKNQKRRGSTHDCSWGAPLIAEHDRLRRLGPDDDCEDTSPQHEGHVVGDPGERGDIFFEADTDDGVDRDHRNRTDQDDSDERKGLFHRSCLLQGSVFGGTLPQKSVGFWNSDDKGILTYMHLKVKRNRKSRYFRAFLDFRIGLKNFLPPKCETANSFLPPIRHTI